MNSPTENILEAVLEDVFDQNPTLRSIGSFALTISTPEPSPVPQTHDNISYSDSSDTRDDVAVNPHLNHALHMIHVDTLLNINIDQLLSERDETTSKSLLVLHQEQLKQGRNYTNHTLQIAECLGGIDRILARSLNEATSINESFAIPQSKLIELQEILTSEYEHVPKYLAIASTSNIDKDLEDENYMGIKYEFDENNCYLNDLLPPKTVRKMSELIHTKATGFAAAAFAFIGTVIMMIYDEFSLIFILYSLAAHCFYYIPYFMLHISCADKTAVIMTLNTFEFWLKLAYQYYYGILWIIWAANHIEFDDKLFIVQNIIANLVMFPLTIAFAALFDAMNIHKLYKVSVSAVCFVFWSWCSFYWQFLVPDEADYIFHVKFADRSVSVMGLMSDSLRIVAIFFAKQAILSSYRKNQCVLIKISPFIKWTAYITEETKPDINIKV